MTFAGHNHGLLLYQFLYKNKKNTVPVITTGTASGSSRLMVGKRRIRGYWGTGAVGPRRVGWVSEGYSASLRSSSILIADTGIRVPGPKMAATPAL